MLHDGALSRQVLTPVGATKLAGDHDQGVLQKPTPFEIQNQSANRPVGSGTGTTQRIMNITVMVPAAHGDLYEPDSRFAQTAGHQASTTVSIGGLIPDAIKLLSLLSFFRKIDQAGSFLLHAEG